MKLSPDEKKVQMDAKYSSTNFDLIYKKSLLRYDLQGWRNKLIKSVSGLSPKSILDLGGGQCDKAFLLSRLLKVNSFSIDVVDFAKPSCLLEEFISNQSYLNYFCEDVDNFLLNSTNQSVYDLVIMFGFLHELKSSEITLGLLSKINKDLVPLILISDNLLYNSVEENNRSIASSFDCPTVTYFLRFQFSFFKLYSLSFYKDVHRPPQFIFLLHVGRVDSYFSIIGSQSSILKVIKKLSSSIRFW